MKHLLTHEELNQIKRMLNRGCPIKTVAKEMKRDPKTVRAISNGYHAGRCLGDPFPGKRKFQEEERKEIAARNLEGESLTRLAQIKGCSVATIHRIVSEAI